MKVYFIYIYIEIIAGFQIFKTMSHYNFDNYSQKFDTSII